MEKKVDIFLIFCLKLLQVQKAISYHQEEGYIVSEGLFHDGVTAVGVPIFDQQREPVAAITVSTISQRMNQKRCSEIARLVREAVRTERAVKTHSRIS